MPTFQRVATKQPGSVETPHRRNHVNTEVNRSQNSTTDNWRAVKVSSWINPRVKTELARTAEVWRLSLSKTMAIALEEWVHQSIRKQHEALLYPVIRQVIREELRAFGDRIIFFLMRIGHSAEMGRQLSANLLHQFFLGEERSIMSSEEKEEAYTTIVDESDRTAQKNVVLMTPLIKSLVEKWKRENEKGDT